MSKINSLTERGHWDNLYDRELQQDRQEDTSFKKKLEAILKTTLREDVYQKITENYNQYLFWQICKQHLPKKKGLKVLEIGSAPGWQLVQFKRIFGYDPYGLEYSESGVTLNRKVFALNDINPDQVIHSDFFSKDFQEQHSSYFDVVLSHGFIEHFAEPEEVLKKHFDLLRKGGACIITIPNISGFNYFLAYVFYKKSLDMHNLDIMHKENFIKMFSAVDPSILFLNYFGTFNFGLFQCDRRILKPILSVLHYFQRVLNLLFRLLFKDKGFESQFFSPSLGCISVKS